MKLPALSRSYAFAGLAVSRGGTDRFAIQTARGLSADENSMFRVASVSKVVTGQAFEIAAREAGILPPYDVPVSRYLGFDPRHPQYPDTPLTMGMLLTHTSGLSDAGGYSFTNGLAAGWNAVPRFGPHRPGTYFSYSNLGYMLIAAVVEGLAGERFDHFVQRRVLGASGIVGGFNWSGIGSGDRALALATYRSGADGFLPQIDADIPAKGITHPQGGKVDEGAYRLAQDTALLSPQGGLRMSLSGMLTLAKMLSTTPDAAPLWHRDDGGGDYLDGVFQHYGAGIQYFEDPVFYPRPLIGHFGNAYGFNGGIWVDSGAEAVFAYALNGLPIGEESDAFSTDELAIFGAVADQLATA